MLNFKLIEKKQVNELKAYYDYSTALGCDLNLVNAFLWRYEYNIKFSVVDETLIKAYFNDDGSVWGYCMPTGKNIEYALQKIFEDASDRGKAPNIVMLTNESRKTLEQIYPGKFDFVRSPENQDYIYLSEELITLPGKKFHAKRNHISRFFRTYSDVSFTPITDSNKEDALEVSRLWCSENGVDCKEGSEHCALEEALDNMDYLKMRGAVLYVEKNPVAMALGSEISSEVFDINFEKAVRAYDGVYSVICNEFAKTLSDYKYINREEDMGIEGLRKSKLSYNPVIILDRYNASVKK